MNWGIIGLGDIARKTAVLMPEYPGERLLAVASRDAERARAFAATTGAERACGDYAALIADADVEVVYIATPHPQHHEWALAALAAGKHVLCEKPMALNGRECRELIDAARTHERFLMEAVWARFVPALTEVRARVAAGDIGELRMLQCDTGYRMPRVDPTSRLFDPMLAGGGLMDIGIYGVSMAAWFMGAPSSVQSVAAIGETGVDEQCAMLLGYPDGALAQVTSAIRTTTINDLRLIGTEGRIQVHANFKNSATYDFTGPDGQTTTHRFVDQPADRRYLIPAVAESIAAGRLEDPRMTWTESQITADIMDDCRAAWGLVYPQER